MDTAEVLDLYRARHDVLTGDPERMSRYWNDRYEYRAGLMPGDAAGWVKKNEPDPLFVMEGLPDFTMQGLVFMVEHGEGEPACHCYRCPELLTLDTMLLDSPKSGVYRPICKACKEETS